MKLTDQIQFVSRNMKKNKLRIFMTILATTMGCSFLIVLASIGFGLQNSLMEEASSHQPLTQIDVNGKMIDDEYHPMSEEWLGDVKNTEGIQSVVPQSRIDSFTEITLDNKYRGNVDGIITDFEAEKESNLRLSEGRFPDNDNEIIAGYHVHEILYEFNAETGEYPDDESTELTAFNDSLIGETVLFTIAGENENTPYSEEFTIVGIVDEPSRDWLQDWSLYLGESKREEILALTGQEGMYNSVTAHVAGVDQVEDATNGLKEQGFMVYSISEELKGMNIFFTAFKAGLIFIGTIAVLIASIGIFNTMTMAVTERTHEIGVMKALGANPSAIKRMFLMESASIGLLGSLFGVGIAYVVSVGANLFIPMILEATTGAEGINITFSYIPFQLVMIATGISVAVAMLSGFRPAAKATRVNVLSALRREA
ncbi:ABC transporter permease [Alteribacter keqinensis]|uniref:ABC transporter permease n=1 Tax=Alteribacter keqinensis TaxID=2483800 RepID=A0A3M7TVU6_9BACI|nr:FtsX-like permease family protein [Alteribacter keqinensis]RNA69389.1 ABC transporter permease [Alteribacter keqinensis]